MEPSAQKRYLGDGVYADISDPYVRLTTEDGLSVTNEIFLEPEVLAALQEFIEDHFRRPR